MDKKKILKSLIVFALTAAACLACFLLVWYQYLQAVPEKSRSRYLNDMYDSATVPLYDGNVHSQQFTLSGRLKAIGLNFNVPDSEVEGTVKIKLYNTDTQEVFLDYENSLRAISPVSYTGIQLDKFLDEDDAYNLTVDVQVNYAREDIPENKLLSLKKSSFTADGFGQLYENGNAAEGSLAMMIVSDMVGNNPLIYYRLAAVFAAVALAAVMVLTVVFPEKKTVAVFLGLLTVSLMYQAVLPMYSAPDEITHYNTAYNISNKWLGYEKAPGRNILKRKCDKENLFSNYKTSVFTYNYIVEHIGDSAEGRDEMQEVKSEYLGGYKLPYYLTAGSVTVSRLLNVGGVATAVLSRIPNMLLYCIMVTLAWYLTPVAKRGFLAVAMLPVSIHVGTSLSYDSFIMALSFVLTALCLNCAFSEEKITGRKMACLALLCIAVAPLKSAYLLVPFMVLIIPEDRFKNRKTAVVFKLAVIAAAMLHFAKYNLNTVKVMTKATTPAAETAVAAAPKARAAVQTYTLGYILEHPGVILKLAINTFFEKFTYYFGTVFGSYLGYLNLAEVEINPIIIAGFILVTVVAFMYESDRRITLNIPQRLVFLFVAGGTLAVIVAACITWTPMDYTYIWGFQGRYILPVLPLVFIALQRKSDWEIKDKTPRILSLLMVLNVFAVLNAFAVIMTR